MRLVEVDIFGLGLSRIRNAAPRAWGKVNMNIIAKAVKEVVLIPYRIAQGFSAAVDEATAPPKEKR